MKIISISKKTSLISALIAVTLFSINIEQAVSGPNKINFQKSTPNVQQPGLVLTTPFSTTCASGFSKAGEKKFGNGEMDWYVCSTPVLTCPSYTQSNGKKAHVTPKAVVQMIGGSPDGGGPQKFRVQYKCDYFHNAIPVG